MKYEIVDLEEKQVTGIILKINKETPCMKLWGEFYKYHYTSINSKTSEKVYGIYHSFINQECITMIACETEENAEQPHSLRRYCIPKGKYAKFSIHGEVHEVVPRFWKEIKDINIDRSYVCDFEEYPNSSTDNVSLNIFISLN